MIKIDIVNSIIFARDAENIHYYRITPEGDYGEKVHLLDDYSELYEQIQEYVYLTESWDEILLIADELRLQDGRVTLGRLRYLELSEEFWNWKGYEMYPWWLDGETSLDPTFWN